jgi:SAM-dependent methyltransferase
MLAQDRMEARALGVNHALVETQQAFDRVAADYHRANVENPSLEAMRVRSLAAFTSHVPRGSRVLDLGCGPGTDDVRLASLGYLVTAIDWSPAMVDEARRRVRAGAVEDRVEVLRLGIQDLDQLAPESFDAAYANFGPLNCVPDMSAAARAIADRLVPDGVLVASVLGRVCPWELALFAAKGQWSRARIRFSERAVAVPLEGGTVWTQYVSPAAFTRVFISAGFTRVSLRALGLFVPPPYMQSFSDRHRTLVRALQRLEDVVSSWPVARECGDHFLVVMKK